MDNLEHNTFIEDDTGHGHKPETPLPIVKRQVTEPQLPPASVPQSTTAAQAKIDAVAALTHSAYQKASQLSLTDAEIAALTADFPDEAFKPGAAGKENLIYIEHAFLRDRLNSVFLPGQWAIVPRSRWAEDFTTRKGDQASRVYVEAMLCIRGCFAAEAVGEMEYYPSNAGQNYGDAVEGAKTAALRRCCKELGIGLQAWKKDWCDGWWQRRRNGFKPSTTVQTPPTPKNATAAPSRPNGGKREATEETKKWMFQGLALACVESHLLREYARKNGILIETEELEDWPLNKVPTSHQGLHDLVKAIETFAEGGAPPMETPSAGTRNADDQPDDLDYGEGEPLPKDISGVIVPVPRKGQKRDDYLRAPDTIGSLFAARHGTDDEAQEARQRLWGFVHNYEAKPWTGKDGKQRPPSAADVKFREALDQFADWFAKAHPDEKL